MNREQVLKNTVRGTFYENVKIKEYDIQSAIVEEGEYVIHTGHITFDFDDNTYKIEIVEGFFELYYKDGKEWFPGSSFYISMRVAMKPDGTYHPMDGYATPEVREKKKKTPLLVFENYIPKKE
jgi:hypothetical protein